MSGDVDPDDLLIRARREALRDGEQRRLRDALESSREARLLFEAGRVFDREALVVPGDDARIEGMLRAVETRERRHGGPTLSRPVWQALAVGVLLGAAAAAGVEGAKSRLWPTPSAPAPLANPRRPSITNTTPAESISMPEATGTAALPAPATVAFGAPTPDARDGAIRSARGAVRPPVLEPAPVADTMTSEPTVTATELFREANQVRIHGDSSGAIALYLRLESQFPRSPEARSARVSLGMLYLHAGEPGLALEQFRGYRAVGQGPSLGEALWGESLSLRKLERRPEERAVLKELVDRFPESAYVNAARKRLSEP
jgi:TolA-binding protein